MQSGEDYNVPSEERLEILQKIHETVGEVPKHFWAMTQVADLESLRKFEILARNSLPYARQIVTAARDVVRHCKEKFFLPCIHFLLLIV
jgi:hypothetical protein